jgi:hypothetical protein
MRIPIIAATLFVVPVLVAAQGPLKVGSLSVGDIKNLAEINTDKMKGQPSRVAWSPDGSEIYVEMMEGQFGHRPAARFSHHTYKVENGSHRQVDAEPAWVAAYWTAKSGQASPDGELFKIDVKSETRTQKTVSTPMGGDLARGGGAGGDGGTASAGDAMSAAYNQQAVPVNTMLLKGEVVGEYVNSVIVPGQTFGWGPAGSKVIAYSASKNGRLVVMDDNGTKQEIDNTKDVLFPGWSADGKRIAWLQRDGKKKYVLRIANIG